MILLAERTQMRFPFLLSQDYSSSDYRFRSTKTQRAERSQFFFATGLFDRRVAQKEVEYQQPVEDRGDPVLRPYVSCDKWLQEVKFNPESAKERKCLENSTLFRKLMDNTNANLGFLDTSNKLTLDDIEAIHVACSFGQAWQPADISPWCDVLPMDLMDLMEYREDLKQYWTSGYGYEINSQVACFTLRDVLENFRGVIMGHNPAAEKGIFYFSHSGMVLKVLTAIGLFKDDLRCDNYQSKRSSRYWRTSDFDPFAANIAFVLNQCDKDKKYQVGLMVNERFVQIPGCEQEWCSFKKFENLFSQLTGDLCQFESLCSTDVDYSTGDKDVDSMF